MGSGSFACRGSTTPTEILVAALVPVPDSKNGRAEALHLNDLELNTTRLMYCGIVGRLENRISNNSRPNCRTLGRSGVAPNMSIEEMCLCPKRARPRCPHRPTRCPGVKVGSRQRPWIGGVYKVCAGPGTPAVVPKGVLMIKAVS